MGICFTKLWNDKFLNFTDNENNIIVCPFGSEKKKKDGSEIQPVAQQGVHKREITFKITICFLSHFGVPYEDPVCCDFCPSPLTVRSLMDPGGCPQ